MQRLMKWQKKIALMERDAWDLPVVLMLNTGLASAGCGVRQGDETMNCPDAAILRSHAWAPKRTPTGPLCQNGLRTMASASFKAP